MTNEMREIREAIQAGERALTSLRKAEEKLTSASNWGLWDIFGGGLISGIAKHNKMNEATTYMEDVYCIIKIPKVAEVNPKSCMRIFPIIADAFGISLRPQ